MSSASTSKHVADPDWDQFKDTIRTLHLERNLTLDEIRIEMESLHNFKATNHRYRARFRSWNFPKNRSKEEWKIVAHKILKRKGEGRDSDVYLKGALISWKKVRKETLRFGSITAMSEKNFQIPSPLTPEGCIIRTPSPISTPFDFVPTSVYTGSALMDCLPFYQFKSVFTTEGNTFSNNVGSGTLVSLIQDICSSVLCESNEGVGQKRVFEPFNQKVKALKPNSVFASNPTTVSMAMPQGQDSSVMDFLKMTMYLVSNNFFGATSEASQTVYKWVNARSNAGLLEYLMSLGGPTVEVFVENLFRLAMDADDAGTVKKLVDMGVDCNEQIYRSRWGVCMTPLQRACEMQSLELVRLLLYEGAKVNATTGKGDGCSVLTRAVYPPDEDGETREHGDAKLVRILLDAGADVNPGFGKSPLSKATEWGHAEVVNLLVAAGADVNFSEDEFMATPLMNAVGCDRKIPDRDVINIVRTPLQAGADTQAIVSYDGEVVTVLEEALSRKSVELIQLLLDSGAHVTDSAFVKAAKFCSLDIAKLLLRAGAQVTEKVIEGAVENDGREMLFFLLDAANDNIKTGGKSAALIKAIEHGKDDVIDWMDESGAQLGNNSKNIADAIQAAVKREDIRVLRLLLSGNSKHRVCAVESLGASLSVAISSGRKDIVEILLTAGADVDGPSDREANYPTERPLLAAIRQKDPDLVRKLLAAGAAVNRSYYMRDLGYQVVTTVLPAAVTWGYYPLIEEIIHVGAEVNAPETLGGKTALYAAVEKGDSTAINILIKAGAGVNASVTVMSGNSALAAASQNNDLEMVRFLLGIGADSDDWSLIAAVSGSVKLVQTLLKARADRYHRFSKGYGCGALQCAVRLKNAAMIETLLAHGIDASVIVGRNIGDKTGLDSGAYNRPGKLGIYYGESALGAAIKTDNSDNLWIVHMLLRGGADPNSIVSDEHQTALLAAIGQNNLALVKALIAAGADPNPTIFGISRTPLQLAVKGGRMDIVHYLLEHDADVNAPPYDRYGATALQFAAIGGHIRIALLLLEKGADVNALPAKLGGRTALEGAAEHGRLDMLQLLLNAGAQIMGRGVEQYERAREFASQNGHISIRRLLETYNAQMLECSDRASITDSESNTINQSDWPSDSDETGSTASSSHDIFNGALYRIDGLDSQLLMQGGYVSSILSPMKRAMVERIMTHFWILFSQEWTVNITKHTGNSPGSLGAEVGSSSSLNTSTSKASLVKRQHGDADDEPPNGNGDKRRRTPREHSKSFGCGKSIYRFACHFYKHDPRRYNIYSHRTCASRFWESISRVKEHVYRCHQMPVHCQRCWMEFDTKDQFDSHIKVAARDICESKNGQQPPGISPETEKLLKCRKKNRKGETEEERWKAMYQLLFPNDEVVPSPYFEPGQDEARLSPTREASWIMKITCAKSFPVLCELELKKLLVEKLSP